MLTEAKPSTTEARVVLGLRMRTASLRSGEVAYVDEGTGPPIVLLHGAPVTALGFMRVIRELRQSHRVIAPDLPGFGYSTAAPAFDGSLRAYALAVEELCTSLGLTGAVLYVNDASGCFGLAAAASIRERIAGIVVASTVPIPLTGRAWPVKLVLKYVVGSAPVRALNRRLNLLPRLVASVAPVLRPFSPEERRTLVAQFGSAAKRDRIIDMFRQMGQDDGFMRDTAVRCSALLSDKPVLILYGQFDPMRFAGGVARFRRLFPRSVVQIVSREEHFPILSSGERVAVAVREWMRRSVPESPAPYAGE